MSEKSFSIQYQSEKATQLLRRLSETTSDLHPVMRVITEYVVDATKENFATEGARLGERWPELSPATKKWRDESGYDGKMLQVKRKLYNSISGYADRHSSIVGTNLIYAKVHQLGIDKQVSVKAHTRKGKPVKAHTKQMKMKPRPFLGLTDGDMTNIENIILDGIYGKL